MLVRTTSLVVLLSLLWSWTLRADEAWKPIPRKLPPTGIEISENDRQQLETKLEEVSKRRCAVATEANDNSRNELLADVDVYLKAVRFALEEGEFFKPQDVSAADTLLATAAQRLNELANAEPRWPQERGTVVRGYYSKVDDSPQPYGLVIPESMDLSSPVPLYVWLHGRNDRLADLQFIAERSIKRGQITRSDAIVLHPFGRSCIGWKSTAEIDVFEAIDDVCRRYPIDRNRIVLMGFSMGGAGAWHIGAHYADHFAAVHAGAGFVDVARYQSLKPDDFPPAYEQTLWSMYDVPKYVRNLFNLPVVAYSGEVDKQKDAADFMAEAFQNEGHKLVHLIGPKMPHKYDPAVLAEVMRRMHAAVEAGRNSKATELSLQTRTLRYNRMHWIEVLGLDEHWQDSRVDAHYTSDESLKIETRNIESLRIAPPRPTKVLGIDGQTLHATEAPFTLLKEGDQWRFAQDAEASSHLRKRPGLQGPIDDALLGPFLVVIPTGSSSPEVDKWVAFELDHFRKRWKNVYRGEVKVVRDVDLKPEDWATHHLICWGDPDSNSVLREVAKQLPIQWEENDWSLGNRRFERAKCVPLAIYPNPLNPDKYLVINSGPTHREAHDRTNSLQNPKLGDWAVVDIRTPPNAEHPGRVLASGFFDENWQMPTEPSAAATPE